MCSLLNFPVLAAAELNYWVVAFSAVTVIITIWMGFWAAKKARTASDFFVAGRSVSVGWNASAISGEYLSAASFMGIAGMVMSSGYDALWYPVCYACGYLFLLLFIAGPLRRFGAYTIPDFAEGRFDSPLFRKIAVIFVLFIGFFYTMPQMNGAGKALAYIFGALDFRGSWPDFLLSHDAKTGEALPGLPYWVGVALVGAVITVNVALGGMKGITLVQAFQYWLKMFAISVPVFVLLAVFGGYGKNLDANVSPPEKAAGITWSEAAEEAGVKRQALPPNDAAKKISVPADDTWISPFGPRSSKPALTAKAAGVEIADTRPFALLWTFSLIIALVCGTAGLPHILVRFYTNPDGVAAKRTTMWVMILIGVFYLFPPVFGVLGRNLMPELYNGGSGVKGTDGSVLKLPLLIGGTWGSILSGITCAGAFAAFMSTFSGLLVSISGAMAHDIYGRILRPGSTPEQRMRMFKVFAFVCGAAAILLGLVVENFEINMLVGWAFAIAATSYFPLLFLSTWWRGITMKGAAAGMLIGGVLSLASIVSTMFADNWGADGLKAWYAQHPLVRTLAEQPAIWGLPLAIILMVLISKATRATVPADVRAKMLVLHAPETLGLKQEYIKEHEGH
ncbi:MAG TPA: cation acetate symporter [Verrucomicrobiales bacterium]|nr:cation acetate symporter [Verrucomicrobiales bacterium]